MPGVAGRLSASVPGRRRAVRRLRRKPAEVASGSDPVLVATAASQAYRRADGTAWTHGGALQRPARG